MKSVHVTVSLPDRVYNRLVRDGQNVERWLAEAARREAEHETAPLQRQMGKRLERERWKHAGEWVAMARGSKRRFAPYTKLVGYGATPTEALQMATAAGFGNPCLERVPEAGTTYILSSSDWIIFNDKLDQPPPSILES